MKDKSFTIYNVCGLFNIDIKHNSNNYTNYTNLTEHVMLDIVYDLEARGYTEIEEDFEQHTDFE